MSKENQNVHSYADQNYSVWVGAAGGNAPTSFTLDASGNLVAPAGMVEVGLLSDNGITEGHNMNETKVFDMAGVLVRAVRNQEERPFTWEALEDNAMVRKLMYRSATTTAGATAEVHTLTITGSPTGGTFTYTLATWGTTAPIAYSPTAAVVQAAIRLATGVAVVVTGSTGGPFTITFPTAAGDVPAPTADGTALTGGTSPAAAVVVATPGVTGVNTTPVGSGTGRDLRPYLIAMKDGSVVKCFAINSGESVQSGTVGYTGSGVAISQFTTQPYKDSAGHFFNVLDNDPAQGEVSD